MRSGGSMRWANRIEQLSLSMKYSLRILLPVLFGARIAFGAEDPETLFVRRVLPIFNEKCLECHGKDEAKIKSGYDLRTAETAFRGGDSGEAAIVRGKPESSPLYIAISREHEDDWKPMPPKENDKLTAEQVSWIKDWIAGGA